MPKNNVVQLTIINKTKFPFQFESDWFDSGRVGDQNSFPRTILPGTTAGITCYEKDWSIGTGCSGWVAYSINKIRFYFCFSNLPIGGKGNCIDIGTDQNIWDKMTKHYKIPIERVFILDNNLTITASIKSTGGDVNQATWTVRDSVV